MSDSRASASAAQPAPTPSPPRILTPPPGYVQGLVGAGLAFSPVTLPIVGFEIPVGTWADQSHDPNVVNAFFDRHGCLHFRITDYNRDGLRRRIFPEQSACTILSINFQWPYAGLAPARLCEVIDQNVRDAYEAHAESRAQQDYNAREEAERLQAERRSRNQRP
ncbi:hypothetical protein V501_01072 [Pseudogymnoascus sp. VKM F-4519 (FW-2642)]|nr:hypothetical protein V501_01072 [Pseudogymnoascus sp. VKM F-4519 (FW-2642)]